MAASGSRRAVVATIAAILIVGRIYIARESHFNGHSVSLNRGQSHPGAQHNAQQAYNDIA